MILQNVLRKTPTNVSKYFSTQDAQKHIQVSVLGAHTTLGRFTSFLLKQNPVLSVLRLQGDKSVDNLALDLNSFDTKCKVKSFPGDLYSVAIRGTDVVVILPTQNLPPDTSIGDRVLKEGRRVYDIAKSCAQYAPRALILVCVSPISVFTSVVESVYKQTDFYNPARIMGSVAYAQVKANCLLGRYQDLDPHVCYCPIIGGPDIDLAVPLFSRAKPVEVIGKGINKLTAKFRNVPEQDFPATTSKPNFLEIYPAAESCGINRLVTAVGLGVCGPKHGLANIYVRANLINSCKHLVTTVCIARGGVHHNFGIPQLTRLELELFEKAALQIKEREEMAEDFVDFIRNAKEPAFKEKESRELELLKQTVVRNLHVDSSYSTTKNDCS